jgi:hypothetical protein
VGAPEDELLAAGLRDAYRAVGETVRPATIRRLPDAPGLSGGPGRRSRVSRGGPAAGSAVAAAAAVLVIILAVVAIAPRIWPGAGGHRPAAAGGGSRTAAGGGSRAGAPEPPFFTAVVAPGGSGDNSAARLEVFRSATARPLWQNMAPRPGTRFVTVAALGSDRTFVAAAEAVRPSAATCVTWLYRFRFTADGRPVDVAPLAVPRLPGLLHSGRLAASADGRTLAYEPVGCTAAAVPDQVTVVSLARARTTSWKFGPFTTDPGLLSLSADGRLLGLAGGRAE